MRGLALVAALALPGTALANDPTTVAEDTPSYAWFLGPGNPSAAGGRIRVVSLPGHGAAAMTLNQFYAYERLYRLRLGEYGMDMPFDQAKARAHHAAWQDVLETARKSRVDQLVLTPLEPAPLPLLLDP